MSIVNFLDLHFEIFLSFFVNFQSKVVQTLSGQPFIRISKKAHAWKALDEGFPNLDFFCKSADPLARTVGGRPKNGGRHGRNAAAGSAAGRRPRVASATLIKKLNIRTDILHLL